MTCLSICLHLSPNGRPVLSKLQESGLDCARTSIRALEDVRQHLRLRMHMYKYKDKNVIGQRANTRSQNLINHCSEQG